MLVAIGLVTVPGIALFFWKAEAWQAIGMGFAIVGVVVVMNWRAD